MDKKNVSMNDVAIAAGVSLKTVPRVINEPDSVRESTRDKVHAAMEALGFRANFAARSLKLGRYGCIGVVLFHLSGGAVDMIDGIADAAEERGFALTMIKKRAGEKMTLAEAARTMSQLPVDGMIFNLRQMVDDFDTFEAPKQYGSRYGIYADGNDDGTADGRPDEPDHVWKRTAGTGISGVSSCF